MLKNVLLTGATGYIGGRLLEPLEARGYNVRCMARNSERLRRRIASGTEVVAGDVYDPASLRQALRGIDAAFYLIHAMGEGDDFEDKEREAAENFGAAARDAGAKRIVYLGGLGSGGDLSPHLSSRQDVGRIFRASGVDTIELRASIIIGSGSLSFEMVRSLVDKLPVMIMPLWVKTEAQPIAVQDVILYLTAALELDASGSEIFEIGGPERVSYADLMREYARQRGLRRLMIPVPVLTPKLSSLWLGLITPLYARIGRKLIDSIRNSTVVEDHRALEVFDVEPLTVGDAIAHALVNEEKAFAATRWSDALSSGGPPPSYGGDRFGSRLVDSRVANVPVPPQQAFRPIARIGGDTGWYFGTWLWRLRGFLDLLVGGVGMRRGRRHPGELEPGDALDFWRVQAIEDGRMLRLSAEMRLPGRAILQFEVAAIDGGSTIRQTATFEPIGLTGLIYWYGIYPLHSVVFSRMLAGIARAAQAPLPESDSAASENPSSEAAA